LIENPLTMMGGMSVLCKRLADADEKHTKGLRSTKGGPGKKQTKDVRSTTSEQLFNEILESCPPTEGIIGKIYTHTYKFATIYFYLDYIIASNHVDFL
jgi:hypothetical protein